MPTSDNQTAVQVYTGTADALGPERARDLLQDAKARARAGSVLARAAARNSANRLEMTAYPRELIGVQDYYTLYHRRVMQSFVAHANPDAPDVPQPWRFNDLMRSCGFPQSCQGYYQSTHRKEAWGAIWDWSEPITQYAQDANQPNLLYFDKQAPVIRRLMGEIDLSQDTIPTNFAVSLDREYYVRYANDYALVPLDHYQRIASAAATANLNLTEHIDRAIWHILVQGSYNPERIVTVDTGPECSRAVGMKVGKNPGRVLDTWDRALSVMGKAGYVQTRIDTKHNRTVTVALRAAFLTANGIQAQRKALYHLTNSK